MLEEVTDLKYLGTMFAEDLVGDFEEMRKNGNAIITNSINQ